MLIGARKSFRLFYGLITELVRSNWLEFVRRAPGKLWSHRPTLPTSNNSSSARDQLAVAAADRRSEPEAIATGFRTFHARGRETSPSTDKSPRLAGNEHVERWDLRNMEKGDRLAADFTGLNINHNLPTSLKVAEHAYRHL